MLEMFDPSNAVVGGVSVIALVFGLVEFLKSLFDLDGKKITVLASVLGLVLYAMFAAIALLPAPWNQYMTILFQSLAFGLAASGFYKFATRNEI